MENIKNKSMNFAIDYFEIMHEDPHIMIIESYIVSEGENLHDTYFSLDSIKNAMPTMANKPIVLTYDDRIGDFKEHARTAEDFMKQERVGNVPESNKAEIVEYKGKNFQKASFIIWKKYCPHVAKRLSDNPDVKLSMEIEILEYSMREDGLMSIDEWMYTGLCLLGDNMTPAIPNAGGEVVKFSIEEISDREKEMNLLYSTIEDEIDNDEEIEEFAEKDVPEKYKDLNFEIPKGVKENAQRGLDLRKEYGRGSTTVGVNTAKYLIKNTHASPEKVRHIAKYFPRHENDNLDEKDPPSNGWISWLVWGGDAGRNWSENLVEKMNEIDEKEKQAVEDEEGGSIVDKKDYAVPKEEIGKSERIKTSLTKKSADFETDWGDVDKAKLRDDLMRASNYKTLIPKAYLVVEDGWEDAPSQHLKYPVVMIKDGTMVYSAKGAQSALSFLEKETDANYYKDAKSKLEKIYTKLGLNTEKFSKKRKVYSLDMMDIMALLDKMLRENEMDEYGFPKMMLAGCDYEYVFAYRFEDGKHYRMPYAETDGKFAIDYEVMEEVFPVVNYKLMADMTEDQMADIKDENSYAGDMVSGVYSIALENSKSYIEKVEKYSDIETKFSTLNEEVEDLRNFKAEAEKEKKIEKASALYEKYAKHITDEEKKTFDEILFSVEDYGVFEMKVKASVLPKIELELEAKLAGNDTGNTDQKLEINFSNINNKDNNNSDVDTSNMSDAERLRYIMSNGN